MCRFEHLAVLGIVADGKDAADAVTFHHLRAAHDVVGGEGGFLVKVFCVGTLAANRLPGECRLVDLQCNRVEQLCVGGYFLTCLNDEYVANDNVLLGYLDGVPVSYGLHRLVVVDLIENGKLLVGFLFKNECESCSEQNGDENAYGLEENGGGRMQSEAFVARNADRHHAGYYQNDNQRVLELL